MPFGIGVFLFTKIRGAKRLFLLVLAQTFHNNRPCQPKHAEILDLIHCRLQHVGHDSPAQIGLRHGLRGAGGGQQVHVLFVTEVTDIGTDLHLGAFQFDRTFLHIFGNLGIGIGEIAEYTGPGQAGLYAGRLK